MPHPIDEKELSSLHQLEHVASATLHTDCDTPLTPTNVDKSGSFDESPRLDGQAVEVLKDSQLASALLEERPSPYSFRMLKLWACLFVAYMCSAQNGFDANTFGGVSAMPNFKKQFGVDQGTTQGFLAAIYVMGNVVGSFVAGPNADRFGRRFGMFTGSVISLIGAILQTAAQREVHIIAGRVTLGVGAVLLAPAGQAYVIEMSHPAYRGVMGGMYQVCFFLGTIISTWLEFGLSYYGGQSTINWRLPMAIQTLPALILLTFVFLLPESPRWYVSRRQDEKARDILVKYHGNGNPDSEIVRLEMEEMKQVITTGGSDNRWWDYRDLFNSREARYRSFLVACIAFFGQLDLPPTSYYFPLMVQTAGIASEQIQLLLNAIQTPVMMASSLAGIQFIDRFGRRKLLMVSSLFMSISVAVIIGATATQAGHPGIGILGISFIYVFLVSFAFAWTPCQALYPTEVLAYNARAKGLGMYGLLQNVVTFINTYAAPVGIDNDSWRFYFLYLVVDIVGILVIYIFFVETKGRNIEEMDAIFHEKHPVRASLAKRKVVVTEDGGAHEI
ncbi:general substrate transporter [Neolentinus lepideus HHB14362 ss-1]|uniref:General substrate transporter n=1 Tax=Neolentinus lepideus HHB14362 ss-1 TaxID=1314782 RepID=A0A165VUK7_9AGAM|nr:general substrate transporter [Neolentinus lepideus HHB14362 ss-1]